MGTNYKNLKILAVTLDDFKLFLLRSYQHSWFHDTWYIVGALSTATLPLELCQSCERKLKHTSSGHLILQTRQSDCIILQLITQKPTRRWFDKQTVFQFLFSISPELKPPKRCSGLFCFRNSCHLITIWRLRSPRFCYSNFELSVYLTAAHDSTTPSYWCRGGLCPATNHNFSLSTDLSLHWAL